MKLSVFLVLNLIMIFEAYGKVSFTTNLSFFDVVETGIPAKAKLIVENPSRLNVSGLKKLEGNFLEGAYYFTKVVGPIDQENNADVTVFDVLLVAVEKIQRDELFFETEKEIFRIKVHSRIIRDVPKTNDKQISYTHLSKDFFKLEKDNKTTVLVSILLIFILLVFVKLFMFFLKKRKFKKDLSNRKDQLRQFIKNSKTRSDFEKIYIDKEQFSTLLEFDQRFSNLLNRINEVQYQPDWNEEIIEELESIRDQVFS